MNEAFKITLRLIQPTGTSAQILMTELTGSFKDHSCLSSLTSEQTEQRSHFCVTLRVPTPTQSLAPSLLPSRAFFTLNISRGVCFINAKPGQQLCRCKPVHGAMI